MSRGKWFDRCTRWSTLLALVLVTLAPSVAHALRHARGDTMPWMQVCSATGLKRIVLDASVEHQSPLQQAHAFDHCAYCALHHGGSAPPPAAAAITLRTDLLALAPVARVLPAHRALAWSAALARAPPHQA